jgi:hypothetical protein
MPRAGGIEWADPSPAPVTPMRPRSCPDGATTPSGRSRDRGQGQPGIARTPSRSGERHRPGAVDDLLDDPRSPDDRGAVDDGLDFAGEALRIFEDDLTDESATRLRAVVNGKDGYEWGGLA